MCVWGGFSGVFMWDHIIGCWGFGGVENVSKMSRKYGGVWFSFFVFIIYAFSYNYDLSTESLVIAFFARLCLCSICAE